MLIRIFCVEVDRAKIYAIELSPENFEILKLSAENFENIVPINTAIWCESSKVSIANPKK